MGTTCTKATNVEAPKPELDVTSVPQNVEKVESDLNTNNTVPDEIAESRETSDEFSSKRSF